MPTFDTLRQEADSRALVRKIQKAMAVLAPTDVELPKSLFGADGTLLDLKALGWLPVGLVSPDGYSFGREVSSEDISAMGYAGPIRSDENGVVRSVTFTAMESGRRHMEEIKSGTDLSAITQNPTTGEIVYDEPDLPVNREYRLLVIGSDGPAAEQWIVGKGYGRVKLDTTGDESWGQEGAVQNEFTFKVLTDDEIGSPVRKYLGGTGALKHKALLGFTQAAA